MITLAHAVLLALLLPRMALCSPGHHHHGKGGGHKEADEDQDYDEDASHEHKIASTISGHSLLDLSSLGILAALKLKFLFVLLIAAGVFILISKGYKNPCLFGNCRPSYGYYPYVDYNYVGYEVPAGSYAMSSGPYRRPPNPKETHLTDLSARVWNSIDMAGIAFSVLDIQEDDCRRKLVCQADRAAAKNPLLRAALSWFSGSLTRYRTDRSQEGPEERLHDEDPCEALYPQCAHHDLPAALGGPEDNALRVTEHHAHLHDGHHHLEHEAPRPGLDLEPWMRPQQSYHHEYLYEYPPFRDGQGAWPYGFPASSAPSEDAVGSSLSYLAESGGGGIFSVSGPSVADDPSSSAAAAGPTLLFRDAAASASAKTPSAAIATSSAAAPGDTVSTTTTAQPPLVERRAQEPIVLRKRVR